MNRGKTKRNDIVKLLDEKGIFDEKARETIFEAVAEMDEKMIAILKKFAKSGMSREEAANITRELKHLDKKLSDEIYRIKQVARNNTPPLHRQEADKNKIAQTKNKIMQKYEK